MRPIFQRLRSLSRTAPRRIFVTAGTCSLLFGLQRNLSCRQQQTDEVKKHYGGLTEEQLSNSTVLQHDDPFERDYVCRSPVVAKIKDPNLNMEMGRTFGFQALQYLLGAYLCHRAKLPALIVPLVSYYIYNNWESYVELNMLLMQVELLPDKQKALMTVGLFAPKEYTVLIAETQQVFKYPNSGHRMNVFVAITEERKKVSFVRFDYNDPSNDPMHYANKGLFHDLLAGRQSEVDKYTFEAPKLEP